jgi:hypothetical protein
MNTKQVTETICGQFITVETPATLQDWIEALGEEACKKIIHKHQCYMRLFPAIRLSAGIKPSDRNVPQAILQVATDRNLKALTHSGV